MAGTILKIKWLTIFMFLGTVFSALITSPMNTNAASQNSYKLKIPLGLDEEAFKVPQDNPMTSEKIELGRLLFFDKRLSANNTIACASCHIPELAFTDGQSVSSGIHHLQGVGAHQLRSTEVLARLSFGMVGLRCLKISLSAHLQTQLNTVFLTMMN